MKDINGERLVFSQIIPQSLRTPSRISKLLLLSHFSSVSSFVCSLTLTLFLPHYHHHCFFLHARFDSIPSLIRGHSEQRFVYLFFDSCLIHLFIYLFKTFKLRFLSYLWACSSQLKIVSKYITTLKGYIPSD